jgi:hypothetical protein
VANIDLRPLSLGEILDRTFSLYREHFVLFVGITAVPQLFSLALNLFNTLARTGPGTVSAGSKAARGGPLAASVAGIIVIVLVYLVIYIFVQGGTVFAISELYLGRPTTIIASLRRMHGHFWTLLGVSLFNGLSIGIATLFLIIPGIYVACRLIVCAPVALLEDLGPLDSFSRGFTLTEDNAGRSFVIYLLYFVMFVLASALFTFPFSFLARFAATDPAMVRLWLSLYQVGNFLATILVTPILTIATAVFYYDLRVRKEAFDLQFMMNPGGPTPSAAPNPLT